MSDARDGLAAINVLAGLLLSTFAGVALMSALGGDRPGWRSWPLRLALGWGLGAGLTALLVFLLARLDALPGALDGAQLGGWAVAGLLAAVALAAARSARAARAAAVRGAGVPADPAPAAGDARAAHESARARVARRVLLLLLALVGVATTVYAVRYGALFADAREIWLLKARVVFLDGGLGGAYWRDWPDGHDRRGYPPLIPLLGVYEHLLAGRVDDKLVKLMFGGFHAALLLLVYDVLSRRLTRLAATAATLLFSLSALTFLLPAWGVADLPLAFFLLAALHAARLPGGASCAGLLLACAAFTKLEGIAAAPVLAAVCLANAPRGQRVWHALRLLVPALLVTALWWQFLHGRALSPSLGPAAELPVSASLPFERLLRVGGGLFETALAPGWLYVWPLFVLALARALVSRAARERGTWALAVLGLLALYAVVYALQAVDIDWLLRTTAGRLLYHVYPVAFVYTVLQLGTGPQRSPH
jgi:hypothetical protein